MATINLTDRYVQSLKGGEKRYCVSDSQAAGLRIWVSKAGKKTWALATRDVQGRMRQFFNPKPYPALGLAEARSWAIETRAYVKLGGDPANDRKAEVESQRKAAAVQAAMDVSLDDLLHEYAEYIGNSRKSWTGGEAPRRIRHVFAKLLDCPVCQISVFDLEEALISHASKSSASRARQYLAPVFDWAGGLTKKTRQRGKHRSDKLDVVDVGEAIDPQPPSERSVRTRNLSDNEIAAILPHLTMDLGWSQKGRARGATGPLQSLHGLLMRFLLLSAARLNEAATMRWGGINLDEQIWTKRDVKDTSGQQGRDEQVLPLSDAMKRLLQSLPHNGRMPGEFVFKSRGGGVLSNWDRVTKKIQHESNTTGWHRHDLREWAATTMAKQGVPIDVYERILNHVLSSGSAARRHYDRYARLKEQREALEALAQRLAELSD